MKSFRAVYGAFAASNVNREKMMKCLKECTKKAEKRALDAELVKSYPKSAVLLGAELPLRPYRLDG